MPSMNAGKYSLRKLIFANPSFPASSMTTGVEYPEGVAVALYQGTSAQLRQDA